MAAIKPDISVQYTDSANVVTFLKEKILEEKDIRRLEESIFPVIERSENIHLVLDFSNVQFLSSSVLGLLLKISKKIYERNSRLALCNINPKIYEIFKITRLNKIFEIYEDIDSAVQGLSAPQQDV